MIGVIFVDSADETVLEHILRVTYLLFGHSSRKVISVISGSVGIDVNDTLLQLTHFLGVLLDGCGRATDATLYFMDEE